MVYRSFFLGFLFLIPVYQFLSGQFDENIFQRWFDVIFPLDHFLQSSRSIQGDYLASAHDGNAVTKCFGFSHIVSGQQNGCTIAISHLPHHSLNLTLGTWIESGGRFIQEKQLGFREQRSGNGHFLLHTARHFLHRTGDGALLQAKSGEDLTRSVLLQIISEHEEKGQPMLSPQLLSQIIRFYGGTLHGLFAHYLENALDLFAKQQQQMAETWGENPFDAMTRMTQRNVELWSDMQKDFLRAAGLGLGGQRKGEDEKTA